MSLTGRQTWKTDTAVMSEQMMQHLFMCNLTREVLHVRGFGTDCSKFVMCSWGRIWKYFVWM